MIKARYILSKSISKPANMFKYLWIFIFVVMTLPATAQKITVNVGIGVGTYAMNDFKQLQKEIEEQFIDESTITDKFPPYVFYEVSGNIALVRSFFVGAALAYGSTGGRVQYRDYSGYLLSDQKLQYVNISFPAGFRFKLRENLTLSAELMPTFTRTMAAIDFQQEVLGDRSATTYSFFSEALALQPGIAVTRKLKRFGLHARVGYYQTIVKSKLFYKDLPEAWLVDNDEEPVYPSWNGLRLSLGVSTFFGNKD